MPIRNGKAYCPTHQDAELQRNPGFSAITRVEKVGTAVNFSPDRGIPVVVLTCPLCGYIELYSAARMGEW